MKFSDFIVPGSIVTKLEATTKEGIVREMVQSMADAGAFPETEVDNIVAKVLEREELGTTAIGRGVAIPHSRYAGVESLVGTV
ncbi:MAG: PTS sugar transporter subunit IIA, partial [Thermoguttaceae bacterium]|nr:PTS sugar transporter subunit IIA [Thermoguttaceae bacterium]